MRNFNSDVRICIQSLREQEYIPPQIHAQLIRIRKDYLRGILTQREAIILTYEYMRRQ